MIPIYKPFLPVKSLAYAHDALDSTWISSYGKYIQIATEKLQELFNIPYVLLLNNGTSACHLMAKALNKKVNKQPHKVLCPDNVYVAAWNSFLFDKGQFELITVKTDLDTWNISLNDLDDKLSLYPDASVLIVHNIGNIINVPELQRKYPNTLFVEDACEGLLGAYENRYTGTASFCSSISFFANKTLTAGESGMLMTSDQETYLDAKCVQGQGQSNKRFVHNELGYNFRITNIQAAILCGQLEIANQIIELKQNIFNKYRTAFSNRNDVLIQNQANNTEHANWMFGLRLLNNKDYDKANNFFTSRKIEIRPMFYPITEHKHLKNNNNILIDNCQNARLLNQQIIILPSYPELTNDEQNYIIATVEEYLKYL